MNAPESTVAKFLQAVKEMRDSQRGYFRTRDAYLLRECKVAERKVDDMVRQLAPFYPTSVPMPTPIQPRML